MSNEMLGVLLGVGQVVWAYVIVLLLRQMFHQQARYLHIEYSSCEEFSPD